MAAKKKTTKRTTRRNKKVQPMMEMTEMDVVTTEMIDTTSVRKISTRSKLAILLAIIIIAAVLYLSKGFFVAATVNGQILSRPSVISSLEKQYGKQALDSLVTETLITQEAQKQGLTVTDDELNAEVKTIEESVKAQGQDLDTLLTMQGMTRTELTKQVKTQKLVEKILGDKIKPSDKEVDDYMTQNKELLPKDKKPEEVRPQVVEQLKQQKLSTEFQTWLTDVKSKASIKYYVTY